MSQINRLQCTICNPDARDIDGIRKQVNVTPQELGELILHVVQTHAVADITVPEVPVIDQEARDAAAEAQTVASDALKLAQKVSDELSTIEAEKDSNGAGFFADESETQE